MREIRLALLEADVNLEVVRDFVARVRERARRGRAEEPDPRPAGGEDRPRRADRPARPAGGRAQARRDDPARGPPGLGQDDAAAKLARHLKAQGRKPGLVAADLQRPAAIDQLEQLGAQIGVPVYRTETSDPVEAARKGLERARADGLNSVIVDTAGRLQIDEELMDELVRVRDATKPATTILVLDSMTGQEAVNVATAFEERLDFDGVLLTKLDGDARGGAALSVKSVTGKPILFGSTGEKKNVP